MNHVIAIGLCVVVLLTTGCAAKTVCANGPESFRPVLDSANSCKVRIRHVIVGSDIKTPESISLNKSDVNWSYEWVESEFKDGQIVLGHFILKPDLAAKADGGK
jgi:hypothetical protein